MLEIRDLTVTFGRGRRALTAVDNVSFTVPDGAVLGIVGESGSGKSTVARVIAGLTKPQAGRVLLDGVDLTRRGSRGRSRVQMVFQDPYSSLDPRMTVGAIVEEGMRGMARGKRQVESAQLLQLVGLDPGQASRVPAMLSGGQRQRVALARAIAAGPDALIADEITSALDVSVQGTVLNLVKDLQRELGLTIIFISHNLPVVRYVSDYVAVMYAGRIVEAGPAGDVLTFPEHPYTHKLLAAAPTMTSDYRPGPGGDPDGGMVETDPPDRWGPLRHGVH